MVTKEKTDVLLSSDRSMEISLESIKNGNAGLSMKYYCNISGPLVDLLKTGHLRLIVHSHPAEHIPTPAVNDR